MKTNVHVGAGVLAFFLIASFWVSTVVSELFLSHGAIELVKRSILYAMWILIPALMITGASGFYLAKHHSSHLLAKKKRRMPVIALNGLLLLLPLAVYLYSKAASLEFDVYFYGAQCMELVSGAINLLLMSFNIRDGLRLSGRTTLFSSFTGIPDKQR